MKSFRKELWFNVPGRRGFINITPQVEQCLAESKVREGLVLVNQPYGRGQRRRASEAAGYGQGSGGGGD